MTGISLGFSLPTVGSITPAGKATPLTAVLTSLSAAAMSVPNTNVASTRELPSFVIDSTASRPSIPVIARSTGAGDVAEDRLRPRGRIPDGDGHQGELDLREELDLEGPVREHAREQEDEDSQHP